MVESQHAPALLQTEVQVQQRLVLAARRHVQHRRRQRHQLRRHDQRRSPYLDLIFSITFQKTKVEILNRVNGYLQKD